MFELCCVVCKSCGIRCVFRALESRLSLLDKSFYSLLLCYAIVYKLYDIIQVTKLCNSIQVMQ